MTKTQEKRKIKPHSVQEILNKSMSISIWENLPPEVLSNVLAYLPIHVLCCFRLVCKEWNNLISQPSFATLRTFSPRKASSILISPKLLYKTTSTMVATWQVLDPIEKHSYKLYDSFIMDSYLFNNRNRELGHIGWDLGWDSGYKFRYTLAADGEFIYTIYTSPKWSRRPPMHIVCNPMSKSFHEIPRLFESWEHDIHNMIIVMSTDNATQTYKIVTMEMDKDTTKPRSQYFYLYESMTLAWRTLCKVLDARFLAYSCIFMKGIFYTVFVDSLGIHPRPMFYTIVLYSCDLVTGAWCKMDVNFSPLSIIDEHIQLVVCLGRLYMVKFTIFKTRMVTLSIWKIALETKEVVKVEEIPNFLKLSKARFFVNKVSE